MFQRDFLRFTLYLQLLASDHSSQESMPLQTSACIFCFLFVTLWFLLWYPNARYTYILLLGKEVTTGYYFLRIWNILPCHLLTDIVIKKSIVFLMSDLCIILMDFFFFLWACRIFSLSRFLKIYGVAPWCLYIFLSKLQDTLQALYSAISYL